MKHESADKLQALADGKTLQYYHYAKKEWVDVFPATLITLKELKGFRVKPEIRENYQFIVVYNAGLKDERQDIHCFPTLLKAKTAQASYKELKASVSNIVTVQYSL